MSESSPKLKLTPEESNNYVQLAEIVQSSFNARRSAEWKIKFGFWGALGFAFYAVDHNFNLINSNKIVFTIMIIAIFIIYFLFELVFQRANMTDKNWKHYYMCCADGLAKDDNNPRPSKGLVSLWKPMSTLWFWSYIAFTLILVIALLYFVHNHTISPTTSTIP